MYVGYAISWCGDLCVYMYMFVYACFKYEVTIMPIWIYHSVPRHTEHTPVLYLLYIRINVCVYYYIFIVSTSHVTLFVSLQSTDSVKWPGAINDNLMDYT